jgi:DNA-binding transcriptional LysR family regulator
MDRMTSMATFVKVVESEGFSAAARALGISPSMATTHVRSRSGSECGSSTAVPVA